MARRGTSFALLLGFALTALATTAWPQTPAQAKRFGAAQSLYEQGSFASALEEFRSLATETGSPNAEVYVARCLRELGRLPEAYETMSLALRHASAKADTEPKYAPTRNAAAADLALLEARVGRLLIAVANPPPGLEVTLNGAALAPERLGVATAAAPGPMLVRLTAPGRTAVERQVTLRGGELTTLPVALEASIREPGDATPSPGVPASEPTRGGGARIAGYVVLGVGVAGMATFGIEAVAANNRYNSILAACGGKRCTSPSFAPQIQGGRNLDIASDVGLGFGIAGLLAGALLVAFGGAKPVAEAPRASVWLTPGAGAGAPTWIGLHGRY